MYWDQEAWDRFEDSFRPEWYDGDRYDAEAYEKARKEMLEKQRVEFYAKYGMKPEPVEEPS